MQSCKFSQTEHQNQMAPTIATNYRDAKQPLTEAKAPKEMSSWKNGRKTKAIDENKRIDVNVNLETEIVERQHEVVLIQLWRIVQVHHRWNGRTENIGIQQSHLKATFPFEKQGERVCNHNKENESSARHDPDARCRIISIHIWYYTAHITQRAEHYEIAIRQADTRFQKEPGPSWRRLSIYPRRPFRKPRRLRARRLNHDERKHVKYDDGETSRT